MRDETLLPKDRTQLPNGGPCRDRPETTERHPVLKEYLDHLYAPSSASYR